MLLTGVFVLICESARYAHILSVSPFPPPTPVPVLLHRVVPEADNNLS